MRSIVKKVIILLIIGGFVVTVSLFAKKGCAKDSNISYQYEKITLGDVTKSISASGRLDLFDAVLVTAGINGTVSKLIADYNDYVKAGDLIAVLDSLEVDMNLNNYTETYKRAQLELESVKEVYESKKNLLEEKLVSQREFDESRRAYERSQTIFNQTKMQYETFLGAVSAKKVFAPASGIILQRGVENKQPVTIGTMIYTIAPNLRKLKLIINIDESDIGFVKNGLAVSFSVSAFPDKIFYGTITQVRMNPVLIQTGNSSVKIVTYESLVECDNSNLLLRPGMTVSAMVNIETHKNVLRAPNAAFLTAPVPDDSEPGKKFVWKRDRHSSRAIPMDKIEVTTGVVGDDFSEIAGGDIKVNDEVLVGIRKKDKMNVPTAK
jgi:HlyD family secretion protein